MSIFSSYAELPSRLVIKSPFFTRSIVSYGIIAHAKDTNRWLIVRRKWSTSFILIMRGYYRNAYLDGFFSQITKTEADIISEFINNEDLGRSHFFSIFPSASEEEFRYSIERAKESKEVMIFLMKDRIYRQYPEWLWPKGKQISHRENPVECAIREFQEETGIILFGRILFCTMITEIFRNSSNRVYETKCWVCEMDKEESVEKPLNDDPEIGDRKWVTVEEAYELLDNSKMEMLRQAIKLINLTY